MADGDPDFDEIADVQGWNERTCLGLCREFISQAGLQDDFNRFALEKQADEQCPCDSGHPERCPDVGSEEAEACCAVCGEYLTEHTTTDHTPVKE